MDTFQPEISALNACFCESLYYCDYQTAPTSHSGILELDNTCIVEQVLPMMCRSIMCLRMRSAIPKTLDVLSRKSAKKKIPTPMKNLLSEAEQNVIYREESEGTQGSS